MNGAAIALRRCVLLQAVLLAACAGKPTTVPQPGPSSPRTATPPLPGATPAPAPGPAQGPAAAADGLAAERRWLRQWFDGTPVRIEQPADGQLRVAVPREFCFDNGKSRVKPPLAAVLAKVAESLRRQPQAQLALVSMPDDEARGKALAGERAAQVRRVLNERGVPSGRLGGETSVGGEVLQLHITLPQG
jgi:outer membrane protein OmpA-like peptidoglycan-associated protein